MPVVFAVRAFVPTATLFVPVLTSNALQPRPAFVASVLPSTLPATVGVAAELEETQALPFHTFRVAGTLVSYQVVPLTGLAGAVVPEGAPEEGTQLVPFQTLRTGGVTAVSYQVVPVWGATGAVVLAGGLETGTNEVPLYTLNTPGVDEVS